MRIGAILFCTSVAASSLDGAAEADRDRDGKPDGDWDERREYTYTVRSVVRVLRPANSVTLTRRAARVAGRGWRRGSGPRRRAAAPPRGA